MAEAYVHVRNGGMLIGAGIFLGVFALFADGPIGLFRFVTPRTHLRVLAVFGVLLLLAPIVPTLRPDIEGILVLAFSAVALLRLATITRITDHTPAPEASPATADGSDSRDLGAGTPGVREAESGTTAEPGGPRRRPRSVARVRDDGIIEAQAVIVGETALPLRNEEIPPTNEESTPGWTSPPGTSSAGSTTAAAANESPPHEPTAPEPTVIARLSRSAGVAAAKGAPIIDASLHKGARSAGRILGRAGRKLDDIGGGGDRAGTAVPGASSDVSGVERSDEDPGEQGR